MFPFSFIESILLFFRTLSWGRGATSDNETSDAEIGDSKTGDKETRESKISLFRGLDTVHLLKIEH